MIKVCCIDIVIFVPGKDLAAQRDREERLRIVKERQNDERQRKLEELKQQVWNIMNLKYSNELFKYSISNGNNISELSFLLSEHFKESNQLSIC